MKNYSQSLSFASITLATAYNNFYVENFEEKVSKYVLFKLHILFPEVKHYILKRIAVDYAVPLITVSKDPDDNVFNEISDSSLKEKMNGLIEEIRKVAPTSTKKDPLNKAKISKNPGSVIELFKRILK